MKVGSLVLPERGTRFYLISEAMRVEAGLSQLPDRFFDRDWYRIDRRRLHREYRRAFHRSGRRRCLYGVGISAGIVRS